MSRLFIVIVFITALTTISMTSGCVQNPDSAYKPSDHQVLYLSHGWNQYRVLTNITFVSPPGYNVTLIGERWGISARINSGSLVYLSGLVMGDTFEEADFDGTCLNVTWNASNINDSLTSISYFTGDESDYISNKTGFEIDTFGNFWMHSFKGTYGLPDNICFNDHLQVMLLHVENNGTAVLSYGNTTYSLPAGHTMRFARNATENLTMSSGNVNFTLTYWYDVSDTITNNGLVRLSNIKHR